MEAQGPLRAGLPDPCVLLGGQPRSGTTLLSSILRCTPGQFQAFELHVRKPSFVVGLDGGYTRNIFAQLGLAPEEYDRIVGEADTSGMNLGAWVGPKEEVSAEALTGRETDRFGEELRARAALVTRLLRRTTELHEAETWGFKVLGDLVHAEQYAAAWPNARYLLLVRDPRDQAMSILDLNRQRAEREQENFYDDLRQACRGWRTTIETSRCVLAAQGLPFLELRYEDLVLDTEPTLDRLAEFLGLDVRAGLDFHQHDFVESHTKRFRHHDNLRNPINAASVGKWRAVMSDGDQAAFVEVAGDLMRELDYL